jgi:hypothetical protein
MKNTSLRANLPLPVRNSHALERLFYETGKKDTQVGNTTCSTAGNNAYKHKYWEFAISILSLVSPCSFRTQGAPRRAATGQEKISFRKAKC